MSLKENKYREFFDPEKQNYVPVKILKINENDIRIKDLIENKEYEIYTVSLVGQPPRTPYINDKMIEGCSFKRNLNGNYELNNIVIIGCGTEEKEQNNKSNYPEIKSNNFYGYKILLKSDVNDFIKNNIETIQNTTLIDFQKKNGTIFCVEDFFEKLIEFGVTNIDFEKLLIEQCKPF